MNQSVPIRVLLLIACLLAIATAAAMGEDEDAAFVYGEPPSGGKILLKLVNNEDELDAIAVLTKGGDKTPLFAIYIPSEEVGAVKKMEKGRYDVYFTTGIDWNEDRRAFNDGRYYKLKTPLILGDKSEYQIQIYADDGKMGSRIKHIDDSVFPDISGPSYTSSADPDDTIENYQEDTGTAALSTWGSGSKKPAS